MKSRWTSYDFWIGVAGAVIVLLQAIGTKVDLPYLEQVMTAFIGLLAVVGILRKPGAKPDAESTQEELPKQEENVQESSDEQPDETPQEQSSDPWDEWK